MGAPNVKKVVLGYAAIAFILLGVLFGMNIMTFIFGSLNPTTAGLQKTSNAIINETGQGLNATSNTTLATVDLSGFELVSIQAVYNATGGNGSLIPATNYSYTTGGLIYRTGADVLYNSINVSYTYKDNEGATLAAVNIQNDSLTSIQTYSHASSTQFSVIVIAIILAILISLFLLFWNYFMGGNNNSGQRDAGTFS